MAINLATRAFRFIDRWERLATAGSPLSRSALVQLERRDEELERYLAEVRRGSIGVSSQTAADVALTTSFATILAVTFSTLYRDTTLLCYANVDVHETAAAAGNVAFKFQLDGVDVLPVWPLPPNTNNWSTTPTAPWDPNGAIGRTTLSPYAPNVNCPEPGNHTITLVGRKSAAGPTITTHSSNTLVHVTWTP